MKSVKDLRDLTSSDLCQQLKKLLNNQFRLRIEKATQQLRETHQLKEVKRQIARVKTLLREKCLSTRVEKDKSQ